MKKNSRGIAKLFIGIAMFSFLFLFGFLTPLGNFSYKYFPLMGSFKWSAAVRIFLIMIFILTTVAQFKQIKSIGLNDKKIKLLQIVLCVLLVGVLINFIFLNRSDIFETGTHKKIFLLDAAFQMGLLALVFIFLKKIFNIKTKST